jgi:hypothetical protein
MGLDQQPVLSTYTDDLNPYVQWHMRRAFRLGWEAAEKGLGHEEAQKQAGPAKLNRVTGAAWRRGHRTQRGEY